MITVIHSPNHVAAQTTRTFKTAKQVRAYVAQHIGPVKYHKPHNHSIVTLCPDSATHQLYIHANTPKSVAQLFKLSSR